MNWNTENTEKLVALYNGDNEKLESIAKEVGVTVAAARSKLVSLGEYVKNVAPAKTVGARKATIVASIAAKTGIENLESLEKASKADLTKLLEFLEK